MHDNRVRLGVNIDHVATLRQVRQTIYPDPIYAALMAEHAGADGITVHLREDLRHIQIRDVELLKEMLTVRLNLEMAATDPMIAFAEQLKPEACCIVPERRAELTTEGGLHVSAQLPQLQEHCARLTSAGIEVSLFIDPDYEQIDAAIQCGVPVVEFHTGVYADAKNASEKKIALHALIAAVAYAQQKGLQTNAGHGLHYHNVQAIAQIPGIVELNIGHAIMARALFTGLSEAVSSMKQLLKASSIN